MQSNDRSIASSEVARPVLEGHQRVAGLWFPVERFDIEARRSRILFAWLAGSCVFAFPQGDLLRYAAPQEMDCESLEGWPLQLKGNALCSAILATSEQAKLPLADVYIVVGGRVQSLNFTDAKQLDPSDWIDIDGCGLIDTYDCRIVLPEPALEIPSEARELRAVLGPAVPPASPEQESFLKALQPHQAQGQADAMKGLGTPALVGRSTARGWLLAFCGVLVLIFLPIFILEVALQGSGSSERPRGSDGGSSYFFVTMILVMLGLARLLSALAGPASTAATATSTATSASRRGKTGASDAVRAVRGLARRQTKVLPQRWRDWLARMAMVTQLSKLIGRQQAAYIRRMLELFESGKLDEALRHAIPLGAENDSKGQAFGSASPRRDLSLSHYSGPAPTIQLGPGLDSHLRQLYRKSFEKLDREGRIDEAVFVLAELLRNRTEALDYLEKHTRYAQAAELALAWDQPSDTIVRLHCLADDWRRAIAVARRDASFANAVLMLEKKWPDPAKRLRLEWGEALAAQGDWLGAVEAVWPLPDARDQAAAWLKRAEANGGQLAARAFVKRTVLLPTTVSDYANYLTTLRDDPEQYRERHAIAEAVLALSGSEKQVAGLARILAPAILADQARGRGRLNKKSLQRLINLAGDRALNADMPSQSLPVVNPKPLFSASSVLFYEAPTGASRAIVDAVPLQDGRYLLAFGEAGAAVVSGDGKIIFRFSVPVDKFVIAHSLQLALGLARRGEVWRVSRLDLTSRSATDLGVLSFDHCALEFDGIAWTVVEGSRMRVLDTTRSLQTVLWQVNDLPGLVVAYTSTRILEQLLIAGNDDGDRLELWRYGLPQRRLYARDRVDVANSGELMLLNPAGGTFIATCFAHENLAPTFTYSRYTSSKQVVLPDPEHSKLKYVDVLADCLVLRMEGRKGDMDCWFVNAADGVCRARLAWPTLEDAKLRNLGASWLVFDGSGRLFHIDIETGAVHTLIVQ